MSKNCSIMQRMKENYENRSKTFLARRVPVIMRLDGKAFYTYTKGLDKPFDEGLIEDMQETAKYLCANIQGAKLAYTQSDEISILITDYDTLSTQGWFNYNVQKMVSVSAAMATAKFNQLRIRRALLDSQKQMYDELDIDIKIAVDKGVRKNKSRVIQLNQRIFNEQQLAFFDSRVFNIPKEEVSNYFLARQKDAVKNSISMLAQSLYPHKELHKKNQSDMQELCFQKGHNWNDLHFSKKRGSTIVKQIYINDVSVGDTIDDVWYQPESSSTFYPNPKGRALQFCNDKNDWCDIEIKKFRNKWDLVKTPMTFNEDYFKKLCQ